MTRCAPQVSHEVKSKIKTNSHEYLVWQVADHGSFDELAEASKSDIFDLPTASANGW
jgi:hypothetical protein